jgi:hypothetical protein
MKMTSKVHHLIVEFWWWFVSDGGRRSIVIFRFGIFFGTYSITKRSGFGGGVRFGMRVGWFKRKRCGKSV